MSDDAPASLESDTADAADPAAAAAPGPDLPALGAPARAGGREAPVFGARTFDGTVYVTFAPDGPWLPLDA